MLTATRYMKELKFKDLDSYFSMQMKEPHTLIEKWPMKLKLKPGHAGAQEDFDLLLSSAHTGSERYVEWKRSTDMTNEDHAKAMGWVPGATELPLHEFSAAEVAKSKGRPFPSKR